MEKFTFYEDREKTRLKVEFVDSKALKFATDFKNEVGRGKRNAPLASSQLRKFYHEFKRIERTIIMQTSRENKEAKFLEQLPFIRLIKSKANYAKESEHIRQDFLDFIKSGIDSINDLKDFEAFLIFFEAVVGYSKK